MKTFLPSRLRFHRAFVIVVFLVATTAATTCFAGPTITVSVSPSTVTNQAQDATITLSLSTPTSKKIQVNFQMSGTATPGQDYVLLGNFDQFGRIVIPTGQSSATVTLHTLDDDGSKKSEKATFSLIGGDAYHVGRPSSATVTILNDRFL
jgi:hypothetical protein